MRPSTRPAGPTILAAFTLVCAFASARAASAEPSIAHLLRPAPPAPDPTAALSETLNSLARRPFARDPEVQAAIVEVRRALKELQALYARRDSTDPARIARHEQIVWAGLSWVDRLEARAGLAARLAAARAAAESAEAAAVQAPPAQAPQKDEPR